MVSFVLALQSPGSERLRSSLAGSSASLDPLHGHHDEAPRSGKSLALLTLCHRNSLALGDSTGPVVGMLVEDSRVLSPPVGHFPLRCVLLPSSRCPPSHLRLSR
jgi:hypothetical protein